MTLRKHVLVVGGGFGGLSAAKALAKAAVRVTLIDRSNHHLFQPLLYQVAMAGLSPAEIAAPLRGILRRQKNVTVLLDEVVGVDLAGKRVSLREGRPLDYDYLVVGTGARTNYFGHDDWATHAPGLKDLDDAVEIRRRVLLAFEAAEREGDELRRRELLTFIVIGGGPTGVELAGAIAELAAFVLDRDFRRIRSDMTRVLLLEGGPRILASFDASLSGKAEGALRKMGVEVRTGALVTSIDAHGLVIGAKDDAPSDRIAASTVLWGAGVRASALVAALGAKCDRMGRAIVAQDCSLPSQPEVFVIGDAACFIPVGKDQPLPGVSPTAMQQGRFVARQIVRSVDGQPREEFAYVDKGSMATIGRKRAVVEVGKLRLTGLLAWVIWLAVHIFYLIDFRNRLAVMLQWAWSYVTYKRGARLITGGRLDPGAPETAPDVPPS